MREISLQSFFPTAWFIDVNTALNDTALGNIFVFRKR